MLRRFAISTFAAFSASLMAQAAPSFELASIRPHVFNDATGRDCTGLSISGNRVTIRCFTMRILIMQAYDVKLYQVSGWENWLTEANTSYDIAAEAASGTTPTIEQARRMLQTLLADRFQLKLHHETKELPVYALIVDKNGPKLKESSTEAKTSMSFDLGIKGSITAQKVSMSQLASFLMNDVERPVFDKTGLAGNYAFRLDWIRDHAIQIPGLPPEEDPAPDSGGPSIFTALQEQLGLKLESQKAPIDLLVVDHAGRPSEN
jgi:uncharacterized protein (TIGR03435 family)